MGVLFADMRGFTSLAETMTPSQAADLLNRFYAVATDVFAKRDAVIDKLAGDEVMALFMQAFAGEEYLAKLASSAETLLRELGFGSGHESWLPLGIGIDCGVAFVGNVGSGEVKDFTAIGDVVNTAARLQGQAGPGQIVMSERVYEAVGTRFPNAPRVELELKGKSETVAARVIDIWSGA